MANPHGIHAQTGRKWWREVDWNLNNREIAAQIGITGSAVGLRRKKMGIAKVPLAPRRTSTYRLDPVCLREQRTRLQLTQQQVAHAVGLRNVDTVRRWEIGEVEPSGTMILRLLMLYKCSPQSLTRT